MRRVLIVTSSYAPTAIADMHRARHLAWELPSHGWDVEVLFPDQSFQRPEFTEPGASWLFAPQTSLHPVPQAGAALFSLAGMRSIGWRALWPLHHAGAHLLRSGRFDIVYITTGHFPLFALGARWTQRSRVPYVLDYHDPWIRPDAGRHTTRSAMKRRIANGLAAPLEHRAVTQAAGLVSVSPVYLEELRERYGALPSLAPSRCAAIPFAGSPHDFPPGEAARGTGPERHIVYIGAGGSIMRRTFDAVCRATATVRRESPALLDNVRVTLIGTDGNWNEGDPRPLQELAASHGLGDVVTEEPRRVTYTAAMQRIAASDGLLVLGVDDVGYMPSKLFTYAVSGLPLLAALRADSPAAPYFAGGNIGHLLDVGGDSATERTHVETMRAFLTGVQTRARYSRASSLEPFLAPAMAQRHARLFETVLADQGKGGAR
jgi:hypothetical protein